MTFAEPNYLVLLLLIPGLAIVAWRGRRRGRADWVALAQSGRAPTLGTIGALIACALLVAAMARPRWGSPVGSPPTPGHDVVLVIDTSRSMAAEDAVPNRLGAAVAAAADLVESLAAEPGSRAAVVAFAGRGVVRCPLTENFGAVLDVLRRLRPGDVRPGGTNLGAAIGTALDLFDDREPGGGRAVVLFSDGEDHDGTWAEDADRLRSAEIPVHAVALGDPDAAHPVPAGAEGTTLTYQGAPVLSRRRDADLIELARSTGGAFVPIGLAATDLGSLYADRIAPAAIRRSAVDRRADRPERFAPFLAGACVLVATIGMPRRRRLAWGGLGLLFALTIATAAGPADDPARLVDRGNRLYRQRDYAEALAAYESAEALAPAAPWPSLNRGAALFQLGRYAEAAEAYERARKVASPALRPPIDYALGNVAVALGRISDAIDRYDDCLAAIPAGPAWAALHDDATINREFAESLLPPVEVEAPEDAARPPSPPIDEPGADAPPDAPPEGGGGAAPPTGPPPPGDPDGDPGASSPTPGAAPPGESSPEQRLERALDAIRRSARDRLEADLPPDDPDDDRKDW